MDQAVAGTTVVQRPVTNLVPTTTTWTYPFPSPVPTAPRPTYTFEPGPPYTLQPIGAGGMLLIFIDILTVILIFVTFTMLFRRIKQLQTTFGLHKWAVILNASYTTGQMVIQLMYLMYNITSARGGYFRSSTLLYKAVAGQAIIFLIGLGYLAFLRMYHAYSGAATQLPRDTQPLNETPEAEDDGIDVQDDTPLLQPAGQPTRIPGKTILLRIASQIDAFSTPLCFLWMGACGVAALFTIIYGSTMARRGSESWARMVVSVHVAVIIGIPSTLFSWIALVLQITTINKTTVQPTQSVLCPKILGLQALLYIWVGLRVAPPLISWPLLSHLLTRRDAVHVSTWTDFDRYVIAGLGYLEYVSWSNWLIFGLGHAVMLVKLLWLRRNTHT